MHNLPWTTASMVDWLPKEAMKYPGKILTAQTMEQKASHINCLTTFLPPLIAGGPIHPKRLLQAIGKLSPKVYTNKVLPIRFLIDLSRLLQPTLMQTAVQLQTLLGLRGGHFCMLRPCDFNANSLLLPPFKFQKIPVLLCTLHVPTWLIKTYLSRQTSYYAPIIPWSAATYKSKYKKLTQAYKLCKASHSSRHTFASLHAALSTPLSTVAQYWCMWERPQPRPMFMSSAKKTTTCYWSTQTISSTLTCNSLPAQTKYWNVIQPGRTRDYCMNENLRQ